MTPASTGADSIGIVTDSACDLPAELADEQGIEIVPLSIRFGDDELVDREELTTAEFWQRCASTSELPSTAAPSPGRFEQAFRAHAERGASGVLTVCLSGALSATLQSAELAARAVADDIEVRVVDSRTVSLGLGTIALASAEKAAGGANLDELERNATELVERTRVFGALDTLDNLRKGGRIGNAKALLATALSIKPLIEVRDGVVEQHGKQRTRSKALAHLVAKVAEFEGRIERLAVLHAACPDADEFVEKLRPYAPADIIVGQIGSVIGTHAGQGTIGAALLLRP